jgi:hypothetical protein
MIMVQTVVETSCRENISWINYRDIDGLLLLRVEVGFCCPVFVSEYSKSVIDSGVLSAAVLPSFLKASSTSCRKGLC